MANYNSSHTGAEIDSAIGRVKDTAVTAGTVAASLGVVVDANKDISGFRNVTLTGQLQAATINLTGDTTIGDGDTDNITINADVNSNIIPNTDNTFDLGSASKQWKDLYVNGIGYIDQLGTDADPIAIYASSGEIDGTAIGSESASTGAFTTLTASDAVTFAKSTNGDYKTKIYNANAGTATEANIYITNSSSDADGLFAGIGGTGFTTAGGFVQDGAWIGSGTGASGGLSLMTRASADMRFYTNGHTNLAMTIDSSQGVGIGNTVASTINSANNGGRLVVGDGSGNEGMTIYSGNGSGEYGILYFADGTSGASTYQGWMAYLHDVNALTLATSGSEKFRITSEGRVIQKNTSLANSCFDIINGSSSGYGLYIKAGNGGNYALSVNEYNGSNLMVVNGDGNVGIGTTSPQTTLHVGTGNEAPDIDAVALISNAGTTNLAIRNSTNNVELLNYVDSSQGIIGTVTSHPLRIRTANSDRITIASDGLVQLNQNNTGSGGSGLKQLSLGASSSTLVDFTNVGTMTGAVISNSNNDQNTGTAVVFTHRTGSSGISYICSRNEGSDASSLHFGTRGSGGIEEEFRIDKDGNLTATDTSIGSLSDERMKEEIADYTGGLDIVKNLKPRTFKWKENTKAHNAGKTGTRRGFIAQEVLETDDYYIRENEMQENETGYEYIKDTGKMYTAKLNDKDAMYISAIQSLLKRIETLENA